MLNYDVDEVIKRAIKYIIEGGAVAIAAYYIPRKTMNMEEIAIIALTAAATFSILDLYAPAVSSAARSGAGFGIGASTVGYKGGF